MNWQEVCEHPSLKDLPFKIELDETGKIIMCPVKIYHSFFQIRIALLLEKLLTGGLALSECAIKTSKGTKVVDVAWISFPKWEQIKQEAEASIAPEVCIDVILSHYADKEVAERKALYFKAGAKEVWLCSENGDMRFFNPKHELIHSELVPDFPLKIEV